MAVCQSHFTERRGALGHQGEALATSDRVLLRLIRRHWEPSSWSPERPVAEVDWTALVEKALHHGVGALLCRSLRELPAEDIPQDVLEAAHTFLEDAEARGSALVAQLFDVLDVLAADGIPALPFKGPALGVLAHGSATIRPSRDIDVLVRKEDMARSVAALGRLGYRLGESFRPRIMAACYERYGQDIVFAKGRISVEPHCAFVPSSLPSISTWKAYGLELVRLPYRVASCARSPWKTRCSRRVCMEARKSGGGCSGSRTFAALVSRHPELDWNALMQRAQQAGMVRMLLLGLALAQDLFGSALPVSVSHAIEGDALCSRLVVQSKRHLFSSGEPIGSLQHVSRYQLRSRERLRDRVRYVWRTMTTPRFSHYRMVKLPDSLIFGYVIVKVVHDYLLLPLWLLATGRWRRQRPDSARSPTA